jgi:hypothetical protein
MKIYMNLEFFKELPLGVLVLLIIGKIYLPPVFSLLPHLLCLLLSQELFAAIIDFWFCIIGVDMLNPLILILFKF